MKIEWTDEQEKLFNKELQEHLELFKKKMVEIRLPGNPRSQYSH